MKKELVTLVCILLIATAAPAQNPDAKKYNLPLVFKHLTRADGLASNIVNCILQDRDGFMWFGTESGLNRYDGHSFITLNYNPGDSNSISDNRINELFEDRERRLWIGTMDSGLVIYDQVSQKFKRYEHNDKDPNSINRGYVSQVYEDKEGRFWICLYGGGLELFEEASGKFIHHVWNENDTDGLAGNKVKAIFETAPGKYLVGTFEAGSTVDNQRWGHINQYDISTNKFTPLKITGITPKPTYRQPLHLLERLVHVIRADDAGNIWFGTYVGIIKYNPQKNSFSYYENDETDPVSLSQNTIRSICEFNGSMFFATEKGGISVMDTSRGTFIAYKHDPLNPNSLSDDITRALYKDRENRLWIATTGGGVNIIEPQNKDFILYPKEMLYGNAAPGTSANRIASICVGKRDDLYIGSDIGLSVLNTISGKADLLQPTFIRNGIRIVAQVSVITLSHTGKYWLGGVDNIIEFNPDNLSLVSHEQLCVSHGPSKVPVLSILELKGAGNPLYVEFGYNQPLIYRPEQGRFFLNDSLIQARYAVIDGKGSIWTYKYIIRKDEGCVLRIDSMWHTLKFKHDPKDSNTLISNDVRYIYRDNKDRIWIITDKGLDLFDDGTGRFIHYKNIKNFPESQLNSMIADRRGNLWFLTDEALIKLDPDTKATTTYSINVDLPVNKLENKMAYDSANDIMYFSANGGIIGFHPGALKVTYTPPPLFITDIKLFSKVVFFDSSASIKRTYQLPYNKNFITIDFTALNYAHPQFNQYAYKLEGLNTDWNYIGNSHEANFTNLSPGTYIFRLKGSSREGIWDQECMPVTIVVASPWWQRWWFYSITALVVIGSVVGYSRRQANIFAKQKIILEQAVGKRTSEYKEQKDRAEKSEKVKQQFLANMSHEIRTPMNAVSGMTGILLEKEPRQDQLKYLTAISKSSDILLHIIDDILDISKIEAGKLELENIDFSLTDTVRQVKDTLAYKAEEKGLQLITEVSDDVADVVVGDPFRLNQVLMNLGGNAVKFTERGGVHIDVSRVKEDEANITVQFSVSDTGIGIPKEKLQGLFENFTQVNSSNTRQYGGTGLGLSVSKQLVALHGGSISVESKMGNGSTFSFIIMYPKGSEQRLNQRIQQEKKVDAGILNGLRVLVADDNEYNRLLVQETLCLKANVHIDMAVNGEEAFKLAGLNDYDVILMDVQMPVMNGIKATSCIREQLPAPKNSVPVIALTASILRADLEMCTLAGMNAYVPKPFKASQLILTIADVTGRKGNEGNPSAGYSNYANIAIETNQPVTDLTYLSEYCEGDQNRIGMYVKLYLQAVPVFKEKVEAAMAAEDMAALAMQMHSFKPKWMMMGMKSATEMGNKIYRQCNDNDTAAFEKVKRLMIETDLSVVELADKC